MVDDVQDPLELAPFRGIRYASPDARALINSPELDVARALAPPYDVVDAVSAGHLLRGGPRNAVRLTVPPAAHALTGLTGPDRYRRAATTLRTWIESGTLVRDRFPSLYVYEQLLPGGERQRGLIGALRLPGPGARSVRAHEEVFAESVADRALLMTEARANLEPVFLLYQGGRGNQRGAAALAAEAEPPAVPLVDTTTDDGVTHRLWAITDTPQLFEIAADLAPRNALIADGHHRYAAYQQMHAANPTARAWGYGLALLVNSDTSPPHVGAIHRVIAGLDCRSAARAAGTAAKVDDLGGCSIDAASARLADAAERGPALLLADARHRYLVRDIDRDRLAALLPKRSPRWRALPTAALIGIFLPMWKVRDEDAELVHDNAAEAARSAVPGERTAVLLPALSVDDVYAVTAGGELTPRKSTSFGPKPRTGLVLRSLDPPDTP
ncbi:DUF1015 domain-containing protein [Nocardiopsis ansamitocini]|uniref:DUF1015 domain-containing protein n=1 Tax=Nocardiopsis ansamitocini TaxID=1670832 RepID=UPI0025557C87|nr:DUF1015 domain-containing protein [Nocardiopsis ansamitocini]